MGLPIHVSEVPDYELRGDCIRIIWRELEIFVPVPICLAAMGRCRAAIEEWGKRNASVSRIMAE